MFLAENIYTNHLVDTQNIEQGEEKMEKVLKIQGEKRASMSADNIREEIVESASACNFCSETFQSASLLQTHLQKEHMTLLLQSWHNCMCGDFYETIPELSSHQRSCEKAFDFVHNPEEHFPEDASWEELGNKCR